MSSSYFWYSLSLVFVLSGWCVLSRTPKHRMNSLLRVVSQFCEDMKMTLSMSKTYILTNSRNQGSWKVEEETIEEILVAKYLGVNIQVRGRTMVGKYESDISEEQQIVRSQYWTWIEERWTDHWLPDACGRLVPSCQYFIAWKQWCSPGKRWWS